MIYAYKKPIKIATGEKQGTFFYAAYSRLDTVDTMGLAESMKEGSSSFTRGEVAGVTLDLPAQIKNAILAGMAVTINGLGTFKPSLTVEEVQEDPQKLKTSAISISGINFRPDPQLMRELNQKAQYAWVNKASTEEDDGSTDSPEGTRGEGNAPAPSGGGGTQPGIGGTGGDDFE